MFAWHNRGRVSNPAAAAGVPRGGHTVVNATTRVAAHTGIHPRIVQSAGVPAIAQATGTDTASLLSQAGVSVNDAMQAGLLAPQPEFEDVRAPIACQCARGRGGCRSASSNAALGALTMNGIFDDALDTITSYVSGDSSDDTSVPDESLPNNDGSFTPVSSNTSQGSSAPVVAAPQMADGWPASPPFRPGNWFFGDSTNTTPTYTLATGDTLSGLARLYLGSPARWQEIWDLQSFRYTYKPDPSSSNPGRGIMQGDVFVMPFEARDKAVQLMKTTPASPPTPGAPGTKPNAINGLSPSAPGAANFFAQHKTAILAIGAVAVVGTIAYAATT